MRARWGPAVALALVVSGGWVGLVALAAGPSPSSAVTITMRQSAFEPGSVVVPRGVPVRITLVNADPIDHEWIVGDAGVHERHRTGTEPHHGERATEVTVPALETRVMTVVFERIGTYAMICHLPAHEAYGMVGEVRVVDG